MLLHSYGNALTGYRIDRQDKTYPELVADKVKNSDVLSQFLQEHRDSFKGSTLIMILVAEFVQS